MKFLRRTRRLDDESCVHSFATTTITTTTILSNTTTTTTTTSGSIDTSIVSPANHRRCCHCPSSSTSGTNDHEENQRRDPSSSSSTSTSFSSSSSIIAMPSPTCDACERLHGDYEFRSLSIIDRLVRIRENFIYPSNRLSYKLPQIGGGQEGGRGGSGGGGGKGGRGNSTTTTTTTMTTRIRTKNRSKMQERNSWNSRYASSVVRWRKFYNWRLTFSFGLFIALALPAVALAALQQKTSLGLYAEDGEAEGGSHGGDGGRDGSCYSTDEIG